jgi:NTE family protein
MGSTARPEQSLFRTTPLRTFLRERLQTGDDGRLTGVDENLAAGRLQALAVSTSSYSTMQTVTWVQGCEIEDWERPNRVGIRAPLTLDHVMASTALPVLFPAVQIDDRWYGDGGLRLLDPLAPAIHLGADRLFVISTRYERSRAEADVPSCPGYPSPLQMAGVLANVLFLDVLEHDAAVLRRINRLVRRLRPDQRGRLRPIDLLILRPSVDLGELGADAPLPLGGALGAGMRMLRSQQGGTPDWISMLRFQPDYIRRLLEVGYEDAHRQHDRIAAFLARDRRRVVRS